MADYNIIYIAEDDRDYLWNGSGFDLMPGDENEKLMYSGKNYDDKELPEALKKCREAITHVFPNDKDPQLKPVEVVVNSKDESSGHSPRMPS
jgi:hypothetical protein